MEGGPPSSCLKRGAPCHGIIGIMVNPPLRSTSMQNEIWLRTKRSAGLMPTEQLFARPSILTRDKDLSQPASRFDTTCWQLFRPAINRPTAHFYFFCCWSYVKLLDYWRAEKNFSTSGGPLRPEARGICHICLHMVNPPLTIDTTQLMLVVTAYKRCRQTIVIRIAGNVMYYSLRRRRGVVVSGVRRMNEVNARRARLVPGWVPVFGRVYHLGT